jgi:photosystem II stability/assembly factor-like uncharacterized protein
VAAGGTTVLTTDDGGATWVSQTLPSSVTGVASVSCPSTTFCVAVGGGGIGGGGHGYVIPSQIVTTSDGGTTWVTQGSYDAILDSVSCASTSTCVAGGLALPGLTNFLIATTDGGTTWNYPTAYPQPSGGIIWGVSCAPTATCVAVGGNISPDGPPPQILATTSGGSGDWTTPTIPNGVAVLSAVSCPSPVSCIAVGENAQSGGVIIRTG